MAIVKDDSLRESNIKNKQQQQAARAVTVAGATPTRRVAMASS